MCPPGGEIQSRCDFIKAHNRVKRGLGSGARQKLPYIMRNLFNKVWILGLGLVCLAEVLTACRQKAAAPSPALRVFTVKGVIKELEPDGKTAIIRHEAIPGYMPAMIMPFEVRDTNALRGLKAGDGVSFQLDISPTEGWIQSITKLYSAVPATAAPPATQQMMSWSRALEPLDVGDRLPDYQFTNELGEPVRLSGFKGQVLAFTFFFTSCPFPDYCPRMTSNFGQVEKELENTGDAPAHWHLLSISFDPDHDTPARLADYAQAAHYEKSHWNFLTGDAKQISGLAEQIGENYWREQGSIGHNLRTVVVDATGHIRDIIPGNKWSVAQLVEAMKKAGAAKT